MTDATPLFRPGFRVTNSSGTPLSGAKIKVYDAGTLTPRTVYSNYGLSSSLGSTIYTDSGGIPVASQGSSTAIMAYTGTGAYKIVFTTSADVAFLTLDNVQGALDTSTFLTTGSTSTLIIPVAPKTSNYTIGAADRGKLINADPSSGTFTLTLTSAVTLGDNWSVLIRNTGTANPVKIAASEVISGPWTAVGSTSSFALRPGEGAFINCNGVGFQISSMSPAHLAGTVGIIEVADIVSAAPSSPTPGARYIVSAPFSTFEFADLIEVDGAGGFFEITPPTNCGWLAYVQDENEFYQLQGSVWVQLVTNAASQTAMEAGSSLLKAVTPGNQHWHQSACKVWGSFNFAGAIAASYNVTSITDAGAGQVGVTIATDFSSANYSAQVSTIGNDFGGTSSNKAAGSFTANSFNTAGSLADATTGIDVACFGDQ